MRVSEYILARGVDVVEAVIQKTLNPLFWDEKSVPPKLKAKVRSQLLEIAADFIKGIDAHGFKTVDIVLTGSSANYNWSETSDLDLHILTDFKSYGDDHDLISEYFYDLCLVWNTSHNIQFFGHDVEIYIQDTAEKFVQQAGAYSLTKEKWLKKPVQAPEPDMTAAIKKAAVFTKQTNKLAAMVRRGQFKEALPEIQKVRDRISTLRRTGLTREGEFAPENLAFKLLRRNGSLDTLKNIARDAYDRSHSLSEAQQAALNLLLDLSPICAPSPVSDAS